MTPDKTPSDLEIADLRAEFGITSSGRGIKEFAQVADFARAVLAKWGSPVVAVEPVAWRHRMGPTDCWVDCTKEFHDWVLREPEAWKGNEVQALCLATPQPTQAVPPAGREPLTDAQIAEMMRDTWGCASIAPRHALEFARTVERAHGIDIKGGQHVS